MKFFFYFLMLLLVFSCNSKPNEEKIKDDLINLIKQDECQYNLIGIQIINTIDKEIDGVPQYEINFEGQVKSNGNFYVDRNDNPNYLHTYNQSYIERKKKILEADIILLYEDIRKGDILNVKGTLIYKKTNEGWIQLENTDGKPYYKLVRNQNLDIGCERLDKIKKIEGYGTVETVIKREGDIITEKIGNTIVKSKIVKIGDCEYKTVSSNDKELEEILKSWIVTQKIIDISENIVRFKLILEPKDTSLSKKEILSSYRIKEAGCNVV